MQSSIHTPRQNDGPGAPDDEFHRAQTLRKSRAKKFLSDEMAMYSLLVALTFHHYLSCITKVGFRLMDADRRDISKEQLPQRQRQKREKRRLRFKGAQAFHIEDPPCEETSKFADIFSSAQKVVSLFWKALTAPEALTKSHFAIPAAFYPASRSRDDMRKQVSEDILKSIAQLKWRLLIQQLRTPYSFLDPETECDPTTLTSSPTCCLDPFWGRQVQSDLKHADDPVARLEGHIKAFSENARGVSHREETMHASQRVLASGWRSKAPLFRSQAAAMVCQTSLRNYTSRTGQSCQQAPKHVIQAARSARVKKITHKRPRQYGSPLFTYINSMKQEGSTLTNEELREAWKGLCHADRADWKRKHVARVATKRVISNATAANLEAKTERNLSDLSPWQIGSARFPLQEQHLESFMLPFRNKASGLVQLSNSKTLEVKEWLRAVGAGSRKYHSLDACTLAAQAALGKPITNDTEKVQDIMDSERCVPCCLNLHPGLCKTKDAAVMSSALALVESFPRHNAVIMVEKSAGPQKERFVVYLRSITGLGCVNMFSFQKSFVDN